MKIVVLEVLFFLSIFLIVKKFFKVLKLMFEIEENYNSIISDCKETAAYDSEKIIKNNIRIDEIENEILSYKKKLHMPLFDKKK